MATTAAKPILYSYFISSCSWRVRLALALKKIDYEYRAVNLLQGEQHNDEFLKINPAAKVPALKIDGKILTESLAISEYLEETRQNSGVNILPKDPVQRAQARSLALQIIAGVQPLQNLGVLMKVTEEKRTAWAAYWVKNGFRAFESVVTDTAGSYCMGDEISIADLSMGPQIFNATRRFGVDMDEFPTMKGIYKNLMKHEVFIATHPKNQPDSLFSQ